jgi:predicted lipid-binding transport protein (Tim44 family)
MRRGFLGDCAAARAAAAALAALGAAGTAFGRAGGGSHSGATSSGHSSSVGSGVSVNGGGSGNSSPGEFVGLLIFIVIAWLVFRRFTGSRGGPSGGVTRAMPLSPLPPGGPASANSPLANPAIGAVLGAVAAGRLSPAQRQALLGQFGQLSSAQSGALARPGPPAALETIRAQDSGFEIETFLQRAEMTFFLVKRGLQQNNAAAVRPYLNDAVFGVVARSIADASSRHRHQLMESLNVRAVHLVEASCNDQGQSLLVHFDLVYRAKTLDDANRVLEDEGEDKRHGERWTFVRAAAARTPQDGGVIASKCPVCGAELRLSLDGTCLHCRASVTNGSVDWVVADVQPAQFVGFGADPLLGIAAATPAEGIASLQAADAAFDLNAFLARVKTGFMALQDAWCKQNLEAGRAFLSPGAYFAWRAQLETMAAEGRRDVMEKLTISAIEPVRVIHGRVFDDLTVRITAAAADYEVDGSGRVVFGDRSVRPFSEDWTFQRSVGVATTNKAGTLENTCPNCGAPLALTQIGECRYCKAAVSSGRFDWVVSRIEQEDDVARADGPGSTASDIGSEIASAAVGAVVGGLLSSLFDNRD